MLCWDQRGITTWWIILLSNFFRPWNIVYGVGFHTLVEFLVDLEDYMDLADTLSSDLWTGKHPWTLVCLEFWLSRSCIVLVPHIVHKLVNGICGKNLKFQSFLLRMYFLEVKWKKIMLTIFHDFYIAAIYFIGAYNLNPESEAPLSIIPSFWCLRIPE